MFEAEPAGDEGSLAARILAALSLRAVAGGTLMGLANLVPGISGGTMLLAMGVYPRFIGAIAEITNLRFRTASLVLLATIAAAAGLGIVTLAGTVKGLVETQRWVMYSLFIGLTLGGVPLVWRMARPLSPAIVVGAVLAFVPLAAMALLGESGTVDGEPDALLFFAAGLLGSAAMILPGVSGGYLLLLLGQYEPILGTIENLRLGLVGASGAGFAPEIPAILTASVQLFPVGVGVVVGVVGVSNLVRWLLDRYAKATLGALLGLLFGAVVGLWPFQEGRPPAVGESVRGRIVTAANAPDIAPKYWPVEPFRPSAGQVGSSLALVLAGFGATLVIGRLGHESTPEAASDDGGG